MDASTREAAYDYQVYILVEQAAVEQVADLAAEPVAVVDRPARRVKILYLPTTIFVILLLIIMVAMASVAAAGEMQAAVVAVAA